jgi:uncharacterized protein with PIN domain
MGVKYDIGECCRCSKRRRVAHKEWIRASRPRCLECGGPLEPSAMATEEHVSHQDAKSERKVIFEKKVK